MAPVRLVLSCEHAGRSVPRWLRARFRGARAVLDSHRGWDPGAHAAARHLSARLRAPLVATFTSRLVVDANRSATHPSVFSALTRPLPPQERALLLRLHHAPHRRRVRGRVDAAVRARARVLHVAVHSFVPVFDGVERDLDVGLLYDPSRPAERAVVLHIRRALRAALPDLRVRLNQPYRGVTDGLPTALRRDYPDPSYAGIELELGQHLFAGSPRARRALLDAIAEALRSAARAAARPGARVAPARTRARGRVAQG